MYIKGENCSNNTQASDKASKIIFIPWSEEKVWVVSLQKYITGSEYDNMFGHPDRTYVYNEELDKNLLMCEHRKVVPLKSRGVSIRIMERGNEGIPYERFEKDGSYHKTILGRERYL